MNDITVILNVLRTHPYAIVDGVPRENPYHVLPEKLLRMLPPEGARP